MKRTLLFFVLLLAGFSGVTATSQDVDNLVNVSLAAIDDKGQGVTIRPQDIALKENGTPREILFFAKTERLPANIFFIIDASISQQRVLPFQKTAAQEFIRTILKEGDSLGVVSFSGHKETVQPLTKDFTMAAQALDKIEVAVPPGYVAGGIILGPPPLPSSNQIGSTSLWDTSFNTIEQRFPSNATLPIMVIISDGVDTSSKKKQKDVIAQAIEKGVKIYTIGFSDPTFSGTNEDSLKKVAEQTGGQAFFPKNLAQLTSQLAQIKQHLDNLYDIAYRPEEKNAQKEGLRKIEIEIINPELRTRKVRLYYQRGYFKK